MSILASILISFNSTCGCRMASEYFCHLSWTGAPRSSVSWQIVFPSPGSALPFHASLLLGSLLRSLRCAFLTRTAGDSFSGMSRYDVNLKQLTCNRRRSISSNNASTRPFRGSSSDSSSTSSSSECTLSQTVRVYIPSCVFTFNNIKLSLAGFASASPAGG
jgi:hypothetical protein